MLGSTNASSGKPVRRGNRRFYPDAWRVEAAFALVLKTIVGTGEWAPIKRSIEPITEGYLRCGSRPAAPTSTTQFKEIGRILRSAKRSAERIDGGARRQARHTSRRAANRATGNRGTPASPQRRPGLERPPGLFRVRPGGCRPTVRKPRYPAAFRYWRRCRSRRSRRSRSPPCAPCPECGRRR